MGAQIDSGGIAPVLSIMEEPGAANPRLRIVLAGDINGDAVADAFIRMYVERPQAALYDRLFDLTRYQSGFDNRHLQRIAPAYLAANPDLSRPCRTAFVTRDPNFGLWARAMGFQFSGRDFRAFGTLEEAERFLDVSLADRTAGASPG